MITLSNGKLYSDKHCQPNKVFDRFCYAQIYRETNYIPIKRKKKERNIFSLIALFCNVILLLQQRIQ